MLKRGLLLMLILLLGGISLAQEGEPSDGLSNEERGYLQRLQEAAERFNNYTSYATDSYVLDNEVTQIVIEGQTLETQESRALESISTVTFGENPSGSAQINAYVDQYDNDIYSGYSITGELRYVDSTLYLNISYIDQQVDLPALPVGWITIDDVDTFITENPHLAVLDLDGFVGQFAPDEDRENRLASVSELAGFASTVTLDQTELDGMPVDVITVFFGWDALSQIIAQEDPNFDPESPMNQLFAEQLLEVESEDLLSLLVALSPEGDIVSIATGYRVDLIDVDMSRISEEVTPGTLFNLVLDTSEFNNITSVGETFAPVEVPTTSE